MSLLNFHTLRTMLEATIIIIITYHFYYTILMSQMSAHPLSKPKARCTALGPSFARGGHSHRRRVYSCDRGQDVVKRSRHFFGGGQTVKQYSRAYNILPLIDR